MPQAKEIPIFAKELDIQLWVPRHFLDELGYIRHGIRAPSKRDTYFRRGIRAPSKRDTYFRRGIRLPSLGPKAFSR